MLDFEEKRETLFKIGACEWLEKVAVSHHFSGKAMLRLDFIDRSKMNLLLSEPYKQYKVSDT